MSGPTSSANLSELQEFPQDAQSAAAAVLDSVKNEPLQFFTKQTLDSIKELSKECVAKETDKRRALSRLATLQKEIEVKLTQERYRYDRKYVCSLLKSKIKADSLRIFYLKEWAKQIKTETKSESVAKCRDVVNPIAKQIDTTLAEVHNHLFTATEGLLQGANILRLMFGQLKSNAELANKAGAALRDAFSRLLSRDWFEAGTRFESAYALWFGSRDSSRFARLIQAYNPLFNLARSLSWNAQKIGYNYPNKIENCADWDNFTFTARVVHDSAKDAAAILRLVPPAIDTLPLGDLRDFGKLLSNFVDETCKFLAIAPSDNSVVYGREGLKRLKDKFTFIIPFMYANMIDTKVTKSISNMFREFAHPRVEHKDWHFGNAEANYTSFCYGIYLKALEAVRVRDTLRHWLGYLNSTETGVSLAPGTSLYSDMIKVKGAASDANKIIEASVVYSDIVLGTKQGQGSTTGLLHLMGVDSLQGLASYPCDRHPLPSGQFLSPQRCFIALYEISTCSQADLTYSGIPDKVKQNWRKELIALLNILMPCNVAISRIRSSILSPATAIRRNPSEFIPSSDELIKRIYNE